MSKAKSLTTLAASVAVVVTLPALASASWTKSGTGAGAGAATSVQAPASASAAPTTGATSTSITVSWTAPAGGPAPTGYRVDRVSPAGTVCTVTAPTLSCNDTGLSAGTSYSYRVYALVNLWNGTAQSAAATTASATRAVGMVWTSVTVNGVSTAPTCTGSIGSTYSCTVPGGANNSTLSAKVTFADASGTPQVYSSTTTSSVSIGMTGKNPGPTSVSVAAGATTSSVAAQVDRNGSTSGQLTATFNGWTAVLSTT